MDTLKSGIQGATPKLEIKPVDKSLPMCLALTPAGLCNLDKGHLSRCMVLDSEGREVIHG